MSSLCLEFGVALRTGHDLRKSVKGPARKDRSLLARRTTLFEFDRSNDLFSDRHAKVFLRPDAHNLSRCPGVTCGSWPPSAGQVWTSFQPSVVLRHRPLISVEASNTHSTTLTGPIASKNCIAKNQLAGRPPARRKLFSEATIFEIRCGYTSKSKSKEKGLCALHCRLLFLPSGPLNRVFRAVSAKRWAGLSCLAETIRCDHRAARLALCSRSGHAGHNSRRHCC